MNVVKGTSITNEKNTIERKEKEIMIMNKRKKYTGKLLIAFLTLTLLVSSVFTNVSAANVCPVINGNANKTVSFQVKTDKNWLTSNKITLTQNGKGKAKGKTWSGCRAKTYDIWGHYLVRVTDNKGKTKTYEWTGKNLTIRGLKKKTTYKIKVTPYDKTSIHVTWTAIKNGGFYGWSKVPS